MKRIALLLILFVFYPAFLFSQYAHTTKLKDEIEINPLLRYDWYKEFSYNYAGRASTDYLKMRGLSWGLDANYKKSISNKAI